MKIALCILLAMSLFCGCERHSAEETAALHEDHGHHEKKDSHKESEGTAKPAHPPAKH